MKTILIAGATGYAGRKIVEEYSSRTPYTVKALVRRQPSIPFPENVEIILGEATKPESLKGCMQNVDIVVSALGITRQRDGLTYHDVDYQANMNLLEAAINCGVEQFGYIHVMHGETIAHMSVMVAAKQAFVDKLRVAPIESTVIAPSGFFSDMNDFLDMAESGRIYLFGDGRYRLNPIHGADLANATANAIENNVEYLAVGGPDTFSHTELATMALEVMNKPTKITYIWSGFLRWIKFLLPWVTPVTIYGPTQLFLAAFSMDMVGECKGTRHLKDFWMEKLKEGK